MQFLLPGLAKTASSRLNQLFGLIWFESQGPMLLSGLRHLGKKRSADSFDLTSLPISPALIILEIETVSSATSWASSATLVRPKVLKRD